MNGRFLLDTNIVIALLAGETTVLEALGEVDEVFLSNIVLGELFYGAFKSKQSRDNIRRIEELAENSAVLSCNEHVARRYGEIKNTLRAKGRPIPENDIWLAAIAMYYNLTVVTRDRHFDEIVELATEAW